MSSDVASPSVTAPFNVVAPATSNVLDKVVAPVTPNVLDKVVAPVTPNVPDISAFALISSVVVVISTSVSASISN